MNRQLIFALMTGSHRHRYTDTSGMCSICHREHSPHSYTADNPGVCTVCGGVGVCNHPIGFTDNGDGTHKCNKCYGVMEHEYVSAPTETRCKQCACGAELAHTWENGVCTVCGYTCTHPNGFYGPHTDFHYCRSAVFSNRIPGSLTERESCAVTAQAVITLRDTHLVGGTPAVFAVTSVRIRTGCMVLLTVTMFARDVMSRSRIHSRRFMRT